MIRFKYLNYYHKLPRGEDKGARLNCFIFDLVLMCKLIFSSKQRSVNIDHLLIVLLKLMGTSHIKKKHWLIDYCFEIYKERFFKTLKLTKKNQNIS